MMRGDDDPTGFAPGEHLDRLSLAAPLLTATGWIDGLARLVAIDTCGRTGDPGGDFTAVLQDMFAPLGLGFQRLPLPGSGADGQEPQISVLAGRRTGRDICTIYFHTDTLPAGDGWTRAPFTLTRQGSRLYGRGTTDMKGAIAAVWAALRAADAVGLQLGFDPVILFCADPVVSEHACLRHLLAEGLVQGHMLYLNGAASPRLWAGSPGMLHLSVTLRAGDASVRPSGSIVKASTPVFLRLMALRAAITARGLAARPEDAPCGGGLSILSIDGGTAAAAAAGTCRIALRRTYRPPETVATVTAEIEEAVRFGLHGLDDITAQTRVTGHGPPVEGANQGPNGGRWRRALGWGFGFQAADFRSWSGAEASPMGFVQQAGVREILLGGLRRQGGGTGSPDEFTTVEDVEALARSVLAYLSDVSELPID